MIEVVVFDAYGTLFDIVAPARRAAAEPGREALAAVWPEVARDWRLKQLQYSWIRAITGAHADFWRSRRTGSTGRSTRRGWPASRGCARVCSRSTASSTPIRRCRRRSAGSGSRGLPPRSCRTARRGCSGRRWRAPASASCSTPSFPPRRPASSSRRRRSTTSSGPRSAPGRTRCSSSRRTAGTRRRGGRIRLRHRLGGSRGGAGRPAALGAAPHPARPLPPPGARRPRHEPLHHPGRARRSPISTRGRGCRSSACPALTRNAADFDELAAALAGRHRLIRLTLRGRGASDRDPDFRNYNVAVEARDVVGSSTISGSSGRSWSAPRAAG